MTKSDDGKEVHPSSYWVSKISYNYSGGKKTLSKHLIFQETLFVYEHIKEIETISTVD